MRYDLKKEREKRGIPIKYIRDNVPGVSQKQYNICEKQGEVNATTLYLLHKYCGYELPKDYHKYDISTIKMNCTLRGYPVGKFFAAFSEKTGVSVHWIIRHWQKETLVSLYDYKDVIDELIPEIYVPCIMEEDCVKVFGENTDIFPMLNTKYYYWKLYTDTLKKEGIVAAKSETDAIKKLESWYPCKLDEHYEIVKCTDILESDIGVFVKSNID